MIPPKSGLGFSELFAGASLKSPRWYGGQLMHPGAQPKGGMVDPGNSLSFPQHYTISVTLGRNLDTL